jgi:Fic family protein
MRYNWQQPDWPDFRYDLSNIHEMLLAIAQQTGFTAGKFTHLSKDNQTEAIVNLMVDEAIKTSKIEGENINRPDVRSSIKNKLGLSEHLLPVHDKRALGISELMLDVRKTFQKPLTENKLLEWHLMLLGNSYHPNLKIAQWRTDEEPMQIVSGYPGKQTVHFEAPPSKKIPKEMKQFIHWFNNTAPNESQEIKFAPVRSAIAHLYFESIHPFDDGNGRIGRAIAQKALSQGSGYPIMLSLSHAIESDKKAYYAALHTASKSNEITSWIKYFVSTILDAQKDAEMQIDFILKKTIFFAQFNTEINVACRNKRF